MNRGHVEKRLDVDEELLGVATAFLMRHERDAFNGDQVLFCRAVKYLQGIDVPAHLAERLVSLAYAALESGDDRRCLDSYSPDIC